MAWIRSFFVNDYRITYPEHIEKYRIMKHLSGHEQESGVVALDKSRSAVFAGLIGTCYLNVRDIRDPQTYKFLHGDKDTFWLGFTIVGSTYKFSEMAAVGSHYQSLHSKFISISRVLWEKPWKMKQQS